MSNTAHSETGERIHKLLFILGNLVLLLYLCGKGPVLVADSQQYISQSPLRTWAYPVFLTLLKLIAPMSFLSLAVLVQNALVLITATVLCRQLTGMFQLAKPTALLAYSITISPLLDSSLCPFCYGIGNLITSDALAYAAFLLLSAAGLHALIGPNLKNLIWLAALAVLGAALRPQLLFTYPLILFVVFLAWRKRVFRKTALTAGLLALLVFHFLSALGQRIYSGSVPSPFARQQLLSTVLFLSSPEDVALFKNSPHSNVIRRIFALAEEKKIFAEYSLRAGNTTCDYYDLNFDRIAWDVLHQPLIGACWPNKKYTECMESLCDVYSEMLRVLLPRKVLKLCSLVFLRAVNSSSPALLLVFACAFWFMRLHKLRFNENMFALMACLLACSNFLVVSISALMEERYFIYTQPLLLSALLVLFNKWKQELRT
ncbi:MAG TPA: hypothetical protein PLL10_04440 [Elusimicrobiales bacterium]|nr:hypothetical protein [Elusimicrobiales bacterium]